MAFKTGDEWRKPALLAFAALAIIGWLLAGYLWIEAAQTESKMVASLHAADKARENLEADLQNLQKSAGTAADLKFQASEAEKAVSEAASARASAQNELAELTRQINDAKLAISGAQEETSARTRDLQAVNSRLKEETDRLAAMQGQSQGLAADQARLQGQADAARAALADTQAQVAAAQKQLESLQSQVSAATAELNGLQQQLHGAGTGAGPAH